jgi:hypothetical protein
MAIKNISFEDLEKRLNRDEKLRAEFLKDPVMVLKREGIELTPEMAKSVKAQFEEIQLPKLQSLALKPSIGIGIRIIIRF